jgi:hypothetical protein
MVMNVYAVEETLRLQREQAIRDAAIRSMRREVQGRPLRRQAALTLHRIADRLEGSARRPAVQ